MKILFLCSSVARQGTFFRWHNLAIGLQRLGQEVTVLAFDYGRFTGAERTETIDGIAYHIQRGDRLQSVFGQPDHPLTALRGCFGRHGNFDVVHAFQPFLTTALPWLLRRRALAPTVVYDWDDLWSGGLIGGKAAGLAEHWQKMVTGGLERFLPDGPPT